ncbi:aminotransferase class I/II-fold pyridoxal phosphate-dependent enzyme [Candidatus Parvarchaeota archaeon]|nr:aminotransferase class I/II-fold pyridoxal phosphate-dependent enzyme [Candidatus Parvarchaeota archaeon]
MSSVIINSPASGSKPIIKQGLWKGYKTPGLIGPVRWDAFRMQSILAHFGIDKKGRGKSVITPDFTGTTVPAETCEELGKRFADVAAARMGLIYARLGSIPGFELECGLTGLHGNGDTLVFSSGMAAISHLILALVRPGDNIVSHGTIYGCTDDLFTHALPQMDVETRMIDLRDLKLLAKHIDENTCAVFLETPANPSLTLIDIAAVSEVVRGRCPIIVDNTFMSPVLQNPFESGADIVVYSLTKSIGGHSNAMGGAVLGSGQLIDELWVTRKDYGGVLPAREASAFLEGVKTLDVRVARMQENAVKVAQMLAKRNEVFKVFYPLFDEQYKSLEVRQMQGPGYMIAFELKGGMEAGIHLLNNLSMIPIAVSLGGVETLVCHPASTTHSVIEREKRIAKGITDGLVRLSVGIENVDDILGDLTQAFTQLGRN